MRFIVDGMLGGLARWLRMLGYETDYDSDMDDNSLLKHSQEKKAILLTRDEELHNRATAKGVTSVLVQGETEEVRLAQLVKSVGISLTVNMANTKCPGCGSELREISKQEAAGTVPSASLTLYDRFWKCTGIECGKTYWVGSHWKRIHQTLAEARKISSRQ
ncbi:Mut7-C RNAse domain-containing protein [Candidatus Bathyarchaeota archaeon]|nr:Mut7-C RNAse domain-containing protein [Candidatus Bathyarchaeota archaeon]